MRRSVVDVEGGLRNIFLRCRVWYGVVQTATGDLGRMDDRLITLQRLIQAQPDDTDLRLELASALQGAGERRRAVVEYSRVAVAMVNRHALQDAAAVCKLVLDLAPDHAPTHELLLDICGLDDALAAQTARIIAAMHGIKIPAARPAPRPPPAPAAEEEFILLAAPKVVATAQPVAIARSADLESGPPASTRRLRPRSVPTAPPSSAGISINLPATSSSEPGAGRLAAPASEDPFDDFGANGVSTIDRLKAMARARQLGQLEELPGVRGAAPALAPTPLAGPTPSPPATPWPAQAPQPTDAATAARRTEDEVLYQRGLCDDGKIRRVRVCSPKSHARNPAFDVTPAKLVTAYVTERGVLKRGNLIRLPRK